MALNIGYNYCFIGKEKNKIPNVIAITRGELNLSE